jgi:hypothetical protein
MCAYVFLFVLLRILFHLWPFYSCTFFAIVNRKVMKGVE